MAETNLTGIAISVEMLKKRFAKKKIAAKLEKALKSQKKRTKKLLKENFISWERITNCT